MNRLLIGVLDILNKLLAIFIIVSSTISGYLGQFQGYVVEFHGTGQRVVATIIGFVIGLILAAFVSGFLAAIITISREASAIREILLSRGVPPP
jgi:hypothetical protein